MIPPASIKTVSLVYEILSNVYTFYMQYTVERRKPTIYNVIYKS